VDEVAEALDLRQVKLSGVEGPSGKLSGLGGSKVPFSLVTLNPNSNRLGLINGGRRRPTFMTHNIRRADFKKKKSVIKGAFCLSSLPSDKNKAKGKNYGKISTDF
jgi:hypothetical protein